MNVALLVPYCWRKQAFFSSKLSSSQLWTQFKRQRSTVSSTSTTAHFSASQMPDLFSRVSPQFSSVRSASGLCFACGKPGHWKASCPNLRFNVPSNTGQNFKWLSLDVALYPDLVLDVIDYGHKLPLLQIPPSFTARNNSSALEQPVFVESAINDLVINGCVTEAPIIVNPLSLSIQKSGKKR